MRYGSIFSKKRGKRPDTCAARSAVRFERLNTFFEETFGTVCSYPQNIEKIRFSSQNYKSSRQFVIIMEVNTPTIRVGNFPL
jgi:hypothetical protein